MKFLLTGGRARRIAVLLRGICVAMALLCLVSVVLFAIGRVRMSIVSPDGYFQYALMSEKDHSKSGGMGVSMPGSMTLTALRGVEPLTWICVALMGFSRAVPLLLIFLLLAKFFGNISRGRVFDTGNANLLAKCAFLELFPALFSPLFCLFAAPAIVNNLTKNELMVASNFDWNSLFMCGALVVAAYVMHYGIYLQDEADHTL